MKKTLLFIFLLFNISLLIAQEQITLRFTGKDTEGKYMPLDSIWVKNLSQNWSETIVYPDTVFVLSIGTGIDDHGQSMVAMKNYPNPFDGKTTLSICFQKSGHADIRIIDLMGRLCAEYQENVAAGNYTFSISLKTPQTYILSVVTDYATQTLKMVNTGHGSNNRLALQSVEPRTAASTKYISKRPFRTTDDMLYLGFAKGKTSTPVNKRQTADEDITLKFNTAGQPCNGVLTATDHEGNVYNTVQIGTQCWTRENMRCTTSPTGKTWSGKPSVETFQPYLLHHTGTVNNWSYDEYHYNWAAAIDYMPSTNDTFSYQPTYPCRGICPEGWHVPSYEEWNTLNEYLSSQPQYICGDSIYYTAKALAATEGWSRNNNRCTVGNDPASNNATGFSAIPAGTWDFYDDFFDPGNSAHFWSSTAQNAIYASGIGIYATERDNFLYPIGEKFIANSVRCLKDE